MPLNLLMLFIFPIWAAAQEKCEDRDCLAYPCFADCGIDGYLVAYGEKYCLRFEKPEIYGMFDEDGQKFVNSTRSCLIHFLQQYMDERKGQPVDCNAIEDDAFTSHVDCYVKSGFCDICRTNRLAFARSFDVADMLNRRFVQQAWRILRICGLFHCFDLTAAIYFAILSTTFCVVAYKAIAFFNRTRIQPKNNEVLNEKS